MGYDSLREIDRKVARFQEAFVRWFRERPEEALKATREAYRKAPRDLTILALVYVGVCVLNITVPAFHAALPYVLIGGFVLFLIWLTVRGF